MFHKKRVRPETAEQRQKRRRRKTLKAPRKKAIWYVFTALILTGALAGSLGCILLVDHNSREVGWNDPRTEFAAEIVSQNLDVTLLGRNYKVTVAPVYRAGKEITRISAGYESIKSPPGRMMDMLGVLFARKMNRFRDIAAEAIHRL